MSWSIPASLVTAVSLAVAMPSAPASDAAIVRGAQTLLERVAPADGPGVAMLIARGDGVLFRGARGRANVELGVPLSPDHVFRIASVTKTFTAALVLRLVDDGKLSLDDRVSAYVPDAANAQAITVRQLLSHTAGVPEGRGAKPLDFPPGTAWRYSNAGYILLGQLVQRVTGQPWHVALQRLVGPLALTQTRYGEGGPLIAGRVAGYTTDTPGHAVTNVPWLDPAVPDAAGGLVSTLDDLFRWTRALHRGRVIGRERYRDMITPLQVSATSASTAYGLGVYVWRVRGATMIGHTGQIPGFASVVGYLPEHDLTIVALGNDDNFDARTTGRRLAAIAIGTPYPAIVPAAPTEAQLRRLEGVYRIDDASTRTLSVTDGTLYVQRTGRNKVPLQVTADGELHFADDLSYFVPVTDAAGRIVRLDYFQDGEGPPAALPRVEGATP